MRVSMQGEQCLKSDNMEEVDVVVGASTNVRKPRLLARMRQFFLAFRKSCPGVSVWIPLSRSRSSSFLFFVLFFASESQTNIGKLNVYGDVSRDIICLDSTTGYGFSSSCKSSCNLQEKKSYVVTCTGSS